MTGEHERDVRDPALDAAWRAQSGETPPPALDATILAAAHRAVKSAPARIGPGSEATWPWRWWAPLMAAAAIGAVTIGVLQLAPREPDATKAVVSDVPADAHAPAADAPAPPMAAPPAPQKPDAPSAAPAQPRPAERSQDAKLAARAAPQPFPARREAPPAVDATGKVERTREADRPAAAAGEGATDNAMRQAAPAAPPASAAPAAPAASLAAPQEASRDAGAAPNRPLLEKRAMRDDATAVRTPDDWITRIRGFIDRADDAGAARELAAFRTAYADADARLPADLRAWAAGVPRAPR